MSYCDWAIKVDDVVHPFNKVKVTNWNIGGREFRTDDTDIPRADGRYFGQDFVNGGDIEIDLIIRAEGKGRQTRFDEVMEIRNEFARNWSGDTVRGTPMAMIELLVAGRAWVEGRPRSIDWDDSVAIFGIVRGTAVFVRSNDEAYGNTENDGWNSIIVPNVPEQSGGLLAPLAVPLKTATQTSRALPFEVKGESTTYPIITVRGAIDWGAKVQLVNGWELELNRELLYDEVVVIDTRPNRRTMRLNGKPINILTFNSSKISQAGITVGWHEVAFRGTSISGLATVEIQWRNVRKVI